MDEKTIEKKKFAINSFILLAGYIVVIIIFFSYFEVSSQSVRNSLGVDQFEWYYGPNGYLHNINSIEYFLFSLVVIFLIFHAALAYYAWIKALERINIAKAEMESNQSNQSGQSGQSQFKLPSIQAVSLAVMANTVILLLIMGNLFNSMNQEFRSMISIPSIIIVLYFIISLLIAYMFRTYNLENDRDFKYV